jgi:hypothetical protein
MESAADMEAEVDVEIGAAPIARQSGYNRSPLIK